MEFEETDIFQAILDNDIEELQQLLLKQDVNYRGRDGSSYLHIAIDQGVQTEIISELLTKIDVTFRDENGDTVLDLAEIRGETHIQELILHQVAKLVKGRDVGPLEHLLLQGWDAWPVDIQDMTGIKSDILKFFQDLPDFMAKVDRIHYSIQRNSLQNLEKCLTHHRLAIACDRTGLPPLQKAVIFQRTTIIEFLIQEYPTTLNVTDNMGRTPLHYAACINDNGYIYTNLQDAGADDTIMDLTGITPKMILTNPGLIVLQDIQRHTRVVQKRPAQNYDFTMAAFRTVKSLAPKTPKSPLLRHSSNPEILNTISSPTRHQNLMSRWQTLVTIIPIHTHMKNTKGLKSMQHFEDSSLYEAVITSDFTEVDYLLKQGENPNLRSLEGWSYLHLAVAHNADPNIIKRLLQFVNIAVKDADGFTAMDLETANNCPQDTVAVFLEHIARLVIHGEVTQLHKLAQLGWCTWPLSYLHENKINILPESQAFLQNISEKQSIITQLQKAIVKDNISEVKQILTNQELVSSHDQTGIPAIHKAIIFNCQNSLDYILSEFSQVVICLDNMERTPLHYAAGLQDGNYVYEQLKEAGAEDGAYDLWGLTPSDYKRSPDLINLDGMREHINRLLQQNQSSSSFTWPCSVTDLTMEESKLYHAIQSNDAEDVLNLLNTEDEDVNLRNSKGETFLHTAVTSNVSPEIFKALLPKIDFSIRDANGCTVLDLITTGSYPDSAADDIKSQVREWALDGSTDKLEKMLLTGWNVWPITVEEAKEKSEELGEFVEKLGEMKTKIEEIHKAIQEGRLRDVKGLIDRKMLALAADETGLQPLQTAVVFQHPDIATFLSEEFKDALDLTDNMGRTALHYAGGSHDGGNLYQKLKDAGADDKVQDLAGKTPQEYYDDPMQLSVVEVRNRIMEIVERSEPKSAQQQTSPHSSRPTSSTEPPMTASNQHSVPIKPQKHQPVKMYIASDIYLKKNVPPPSTVDGKYVAQHMGTALTLALAEIAERRPWDPIEYLAHWLYKYRENLDHIKKQEDLLNKIRSEEAELEEEEELRSKRKEEQKQIQEEEERKRKEEEEEERKKKEQEELQRKAKEAAFAQKPHLPTVAEEGEEDTMYKDRDENGQTELHKLAAQQGVDLVALVNLGYSLADRDANNRTPRDVAEESGIQDNVEIIDSYITNMIEQEKTDSLQQLILDGYDKLNVVLEKVSTDGLPEEITEFIQSLPDFQEKISAVFKAVQSGILRDVMQAMERKKLAMAKDVYGRSPLHVAVVAEYKDIVEYILKNFPGAVKCRDSLNRTPLHYAMAVSDELADLLKENGADSEVKDVKQRTPSYYKDEKDDILQLKETLSNQGGDNSQQDEREEETEQGQQETKAEGEQSADVN